MARLTGLEKMSYAELLEARELIEAALTERKALEARETKAKMRELAEQAGFSLEELFGGRGKKPVVVKFRNPKNAEETWTGRGRKPNWLVMAIKKGAKLESFGV